LGGGGAAAGVRVRGQGQPLHHAQPQAAPGAARPGQLLSQRRAGPGPPHPHTFSASVVRALGRRTGPFLWQLPATYRFEAERLESFMTLLPRTSAEAEALARDNDQRLKKRALPEAAERPD